MSTRSNQPGSSADVAVRLSGLVLASSGSNEHGFNVGATLFSAAHAPSRESRGNGGSGGGAALRPADARGAGLYNDHAWSALQAASFAAAEIHGDEYTASMRVSGLALEKRRPLSQDAGGRSSARGAGATAADDDADDFGLAEGTTQRGASIDHGGVPSFQRFFGDGGDSSQPPDANSKAALMISKRLRLDRGSSVAGAQTAASSPGIPTVVRGAFVAVLPPDAHPVTVAAPPSSSLSVRSRALAIDETWLSESAGRGGPSSAPLALPATTLSQPSPLHPSLAPRSRRVGAASYLPLVEPSLGPFFGAARPPAANEGTRARAGAGVFFASAHAAAPPNADVESRPTSPFLPSDFSRPATPFQPSVSHSLERTPTAAGFASASLSPVPRSASAWNTPLLSVVVPTPDASKYVAPDAVSPRAPQADSLFQKLLLLTPPSASGGARAPSKGGARLGVTLDPGVFNAAFMAQDAGIDAQGALTAAPRETSGAGGGAGNFLTIGLPAGSEGSDAPTPSAVDPAALAATGAPPVFCRQAIPPQHVFAPRPTVPSTRNRNSPSPLRLDADGEPFNKHLMPVSGNGWQEYAGSDDSEPQAQ
jgi:hypothetical protein